MKNKLEIQKELMVRNLEKDELQGYIDNLIKTTYENYISNNPNIVKKNVNELNSLITSLESKYMNVREYINQRIVIISNKIFKTLFDRDCELYSPSFKYDIDYTFESQFNLTEYVGGEKDDMRITLECIDNDMEKFMAFIRDMPQFKYYFKDEITIQSRVPRKMILKVTQFMEDVKSGKYDGYLEIPEDYIIDDEDYLDDFTYFENRHRENRNKAPSDEVFNGGD